MLPQACATLRRWPPPTKSNSLPGGGLLRGESRSSALFDVACGRAHDQVREVAVADKSKHLGVLLALDRVHGGLAQWSKHHLPEVGFIDESARLSFVAHVAGHVAQL